MVSPWKDTAIYCLGLTLQDGVLKNPTLRLWDHISTPCRSQYNKTQPLLRPSRKHCVHLSSLICFSPVHACEELLPPATSIYLKKMWLTITNMSNEILDCRTYSFPYQRHAVLVSFVGVPNFFLVFCFLCMLCYVTFQNFTASWYYAEKSTTKNCYILT